MEDDFRITRDGKQWKAVALSERALQLAESDARFRDGEAPIEPSAVNSVYLELSGRGYFIGTPHGLPPQNPAPLLLAALLVVLTVLVAALLVAG